MFFFLQLFHDDFSDLQFCRAISFLGPRTLLSQFVMLPGGGCDDSWSCGWFVREQPFLGFRGPLIISARNFL